MISGSRTWFEFQPGNSVLICFFPGNFPGFFAKLTQLHSFAFPAQILVCSLLIQR